MHVVAESKVNVGTSLTLGEALLAEFKDGFYKSTKSQVMTMDVYKKVIKVGEKLSMTWKTYMAD